MTSCSCALGALRHGGHTSRPSAPSASFWGADLVVAPPPPLPAGPPRCGRLSRAAPAPPAAARMSSNPGPGALEPEMLRQQLLSDPALMAQVRARNPVVADAVHDPARFTALMQQQMQTQLGQQRELQRLQVRAPRVAPWVGPSSRSRRQSPVSSHTPGRPGSTWLSRTRTISRSNAVWKRRFDSRT